ncbi:MAG: phage virion morphogenesis protein [Azonexus sp.]
MITVDVQDHGVQDALQALSKRVSNMQPILKAIGEDIKERTKQRFATSTGPDGQRWQGNSIATIQAMLASARARKGSVLKNGNLSKKVQTGLAGKKLLVDTGSLARQFHVSANANSVTVGNSMIYAAIHQFGGKAGKGKKVTIPARPFLPVKSDGSLYPQEQRLVLAALNAYLAGK